MLGCYQACHTCWCFWKYLQSDLSKVKFFQLIWRQSKSVLEPLVPCYSRAYSLVTAYYLVVPFYFNSSEL